MINPVSEILLGESKEGVQFMTPMAAAAKDIYVRALRAGLDVTLTAANQEVSIDPQSGLLEASLNLCEVEGYRPSVAEYYKLVDIMTGALAALKEVKNEWKAPTK
jgi:hypothetical protein